MIIAGANKGTMAFSLVGEAYNPGLAEVPMGIPLRRLTFDIDGVTDTRQLRRVQTGGS